MISGHVLAQSDDDDVSGEGAAKRRPFDRPNSPMPIDLARGIAERAPQRTEATLAVDNTLGAMTGFGEDLD